MSAKKAKASGTQKTDPHCPTRDERLFVFLSLETNQAYCLFLQNTIPIFEKANLSLQALPSRHSLKIRKPILAETVPRTAQLRLPQQGAQKEDEDFIIGQETRTAVDKLKPSEKQEFFETTLRQCATT